MALHDPHEEPKGEPLTLEMVAEHLVHLQEAVIHLNNVVIAMQRRELERERRK